MSQDAFVKTESLTDGCSNDLGEILTENFPLARSCRLIAQRKLTIVTTIYIHCGYTQCVSLTKFLHRSGVWRSRKILRIKGLSGALYRGKCWCRPNYYVHGDLSESGAAPEKCHQTQKSSTIAKKLLFSHKRQTSSTTGQFLK